MMHLPELHALTVHQLLIVTTEEIPSHDLIRRAGRQAKCANKLISCSRLMRFLSQLLRNHGHHLHCLSIYLMWCSNQSIWALSERPPHPFLWPQAHTSPCHAPPTLLAPISVLVSILFLALHSFVSYISCSSWLDNQPSRAGRQAHVVRTARCWTFNYSSKRCYGRLDW